MPSRSPGPVPGSSARTRRRCCRRHPAPPCPEPSRSPGRSPRHGATHVDETRSRRRGSACPARRPKRRSGSPSPGAAEGQRVGSSNDGDRRAVGHPVGTAKEIPTGLARSVWAIGLQRIVLAERPLAARTVHFVGRYEDHRGSDLRQASEHDVRSTTLVSTNGVGWAMLLSTNDSAAAWTTCSASRTSVSTRCGWSHRRGRTGNGDGPREQRDQQASGVCQIVHDGDLHAAFQQQVDAMGADEPGPAGDEHAEGVGGHGPRILSQATEGSRM